MCRPTRLAPSRLTSGGRVVLAREPLAVPGVPPPPRRQGWAAPVVSRRFRAVELRTPRSGVRHRQERDRLRTRTASGRPSLPAAQMEQPDGQAVEQPDGQAELASLRSASCAGPAGLRAATMGLADMRTGSPACPAMPDWAAAGQVDERRRRASRHQHRAKAGDQRPEPAAVDAPATDRPAKPARAEQARAEPARAEPARAEQARAEAAQAEPEPGDPVLWRAVSSRSGSD